MMKKIIVTLTVVALCAAALVAPVAARVSHYGGGGGQVGPSGGSVGRTGVPAQQPSRVNGGGQAGNRPPVNHQGGGNISNSGNNNVTVNRGGNTVNVNGGYQNGCCWNGGGCCYSSGQVSTAAIVGASVGVVAGAAAANRRYAYGTTVYALPGGCVSSPYNSLTYYNCSGTWFQPVMAGGSVTYIVVNAP